MEEFIIIPTFTTEREQQLIEFMTCKESEAEEAEQGFELGTTDSKGRAHDHGAKTPPQLHPRLCYSPTVSVSASQVPARLWE